MMNKETDFQQVDFSDSPCGNSLKDFKVLTHIGKGSFGSVYKVLSHKNRQIWVMKKISGLSTLKKPYQDAAIKEVLILK